MQRGTGWDKSVLIWVSDALGLCNYPLHFISYSDQRIELDTLFYPEIDIKCTGPVKGLKGLYCDLESPWKGPNWPEEPVSWFLKKVLDKAKQFGPNLDPLKHLLISSALSRTFL